MVKVVSVIRPFDVNQDIYIFEDGNPIGNESITLENFIPQILDIIAKYNSNQLDLVGPKNFASGLKDTILKNEELLNYTKGNELIINII